MTQSVLPYRLRHVEKQKRAKRQAPDSGLEDAMKLPVEKLSSMTPEQERQFWEQFECDLDSDTGEAAQAHLAAGRPIYYGDPAYPGHVVKEYPDGRRQVVDFDLKTGVETVIQDL